MDDKMVSDVQKGMQFAVQFIPAITKLKNAKDSHSGCTLTPEEVEGVIEAFQILRKGPQ